MLSLLTQNRCKTGRCAQMGLAFAKTPDILRCSISSLVWQEVTITRQMAYFEGFEKQHINPPHPYVSGEGLLQHSRDGNTPLGKK
mmetsp:Transcript_11135/g.20011  ORF Transcript_11135/g.20011 Transcript_11135/m.20011 type:complete len:85 (-) Transcript_11135:1362-1616(-)